MKNRIHLAYIALGFAVIIPLGISVFLIQKSYELERKKFDIEVMQIAGNVFYSFRADYILLDSIVAADYIPVLNRTGNTLSGKPLKKDFLKVYRSYAHLDDTLGQQLLRNGYKNEFEYALEITYFKVVLRDKQIPIISDSSETGSVMRLFGNLKSKKTAANYSFYLMGTNNYVRANLFVDYPGRNKFIIDRIWGMIAGILVSMCCLILILLYTVKVIFWQKKVSEMKSHFIDNITHEFNTPVSTLKVLATNIKQINREFNSEALSELGARINNQANRLAALIERVMDVSLHEGHEYTYDYKPIALHSLLHDIVGKFKQTYNDKIAALELTTLATNDSIIADEYYLSIAVLNVLDNALKYAKGKAEIELATRNENNHIYLNISDKGIGIKPSELKRVFKRFYRGGTKNIYKTTGLGLGLFIVKQVINAHGGKVSAKSKLGVGSQFSIILPLDAEKYKLPLIGV